MEAESSTTRSGALLPMVKLRIWGITPMKKPTICQLKKQNKLMYLETHRNTLNYPTMDSSILTVFR